MAVNYPAFLQVPHQVQVVGVGEEEVVAQNSEPEAVVGEEEGEVLQNAWALMEGEQLVALEGEQLVALMEEVVEGLQTWKLEDEVA